MLTQSRIYIYIYAELALLRDRAKVLVSAVEDLLIATAIVARGKSSELKKSLQANVAMRRWMGGKSNALGGLCTMQIFCRRK